MKSFDERLREHLLKSDTPSKLSFEEGARWCKERDDSAYAGAYMSGIFAGVCLTILFQILVKL